MPQHTRMAISLQRVIRSTSCLVLGRDFRGRWIERRYLRFEQIQDGGRRHVGKVSNGHISATVRPIHFMYGYRVGFSRTVDLMALFSIRTNSRWRPPPSAAILDNFEWPYLHNSWRSTYIAIAQLSCYVSGLYWLIDWLIFWGHWGYAIFGKALLVAAKGCRVWYEPPQ